MTNDVVTKYNISIHHQAFSSLKDLCSTLREMYTAGVSAPIITKSKYRTLPVKFKADSLETSNNTFKQITGLLTMQYSFLAHALVSDVYSCVSLLSQQTPSSNRVMRLETPTVSSSGGHLKQDLCFSLEKNSN